MEYLWRASWQAGVLALLVIALRWTMGRRLPARWRGWLWMLVLLRLALPALPPSPWSLFNLVPAASSHVSGEIQWPVETIIVHVVPSEPFTSMPKKAIDWMATLMEIWLAGAGGLALWTVFVNLRFAWRIRRCSEPAAEVMVLLVELGREMGVVRLPRIVMTDALATPALFGVFGSRLLLPVDLFQRLTDAEARFVLLHELAHIRRRDLVVGWIGCVLRIVHWFNPVIWISFACQRADAESACDEMVLSITECDRRREYGYTLLKLAARFSPAAGVSALGMVDGKMQLRQRLVEIARFRRQTVRWSIVGAIVLAIVAWLGLTDARKLSAQPATKVSAETLVAHRYEVADIAAFPYLDYSPDLPEMKEPKPDPYKRALGIMDVIRKAAPDEAWTGAIDADHFKTVGLTITAFPSTQVEIENIIEQMRSDMTVQVSVETRLFEFDPKDVEKLSFALPVHAEPPAPVFISQAQFMELFRKVEADKETQTLTAPRLTLWNHQSAGIEVSSPQAYVAGYTATTAPTGQVHYEPKTANIPQLSIILNVHVAVIEGQPTTALDMHLKLSQLMSLAEKTVEGHQELKFRVPDEFVSEVSAKLNVKFGETALFAGGVNKDTNHILLMAIKPMVLNTDRTKAAQEFPLLK